MNGYGEYCEWLAGQGLSMDYADNGINPFKDNDARDEEETETETEGEEEPV